ncbi:hypothetical protein [Streptomyces sp. NPDC051642]|uniref:hypothetical protein n=1 Tax=unclassified Streptomyces TaxID=2593676 RepID=UPI003427D17A
MSQETCTLATQLVRGMGSFFKNCECSRQSRCPHPYAIQTAALDRLNKVYDQKRNIQRQVCSVILTIQDRLASTSAAGSHVVGHRPTDHASGGQVRDDDKASPHHGSLLRGQERLRRDPWTRRSQ